MINLFNFETAHLYGDALPALWKCRYKEFIERQQYDVPSYNGMEYDQYDTPAAVYVVWKDVNQNIKAGIRLLPTNRPYMIKDLWPHTVKTDPIPESVRTWEVTRFFISPEVTGEDRQRAHGETLCAILEFGLYCGIQKFLGTAPPNLWAYTFRKCGWPTRPVGDVINIGFSENIQSCFMDVSPEILASVRETMNIPEPVVPNIEMIVKKESLMSSLNNPIRLPTKSFSRRNSSPPKSIGNEPMPSLGNATRQAASFGHP